MSEEDDKYEFDGKTVCIAETWTPNKKERMALLFRFENGSEICVPFSVIHEDSEVYHKGASGKLLVKSWWAEKEGYE